MFGCHNCKNRPVPGTPYERSPCATCSAGNDPSVRSIRCDLQDVIPDPHCFTDEILQTEQETRLYREDLLSAMARALTILVDLKSSAPETFRVVEAKIADPYASYSQLAEKLCCRKQNVFYHLQKAFGICPELKFSLTAERSRSGKK